MAHGHEDRLAREALQRYIHRKAGINILPRVAVGQDYNAIERLQRLHSLPDGAPLIVQDEAGVLIWVPGIDGPVNG